MPCSFWRWILSAFVAPCGIVCAMSWNMERSAAQNEVRPNPPSLDELAKVKAAYQQELKSLGDELLGKLAAALEIERAKSAPERDLEITRKRIDYLEQDRLRLLERGEWPTSISVAEIKYHWTNDHRSKVRDAYRKASADAVGRGDETSRKKLADELALFDRMNDLAPWQDLSPWADMGRGEQAWNRVGDNFTAPARGPSGGARNPLRFRRPMPTEYSVRFAIKWIEGDGGLVLGLVDSLGQQFEVPLSRAMPAVSAETEKPSGSDAKPSSEAHATPSNPAAPSAAGPTAASSFAAGDSVRVAVDVMRDRVSVVLDGRVVWSWTEGQSFPAATEAPPAGGPEIFVGSNDGFTRFKVLSAELKCLARVNAPMQLADGRPLRPIAPISSIPPIPSAQSTEAPQAKTVVSPEVAVRYDKPAVLASLSRGLDWLIRHQDKDGGWKLESYTNVCPTELPCIQPGHKYAEEYDPGVSGLATLALWRVFAQASKSVNNDAIDMDRIHAAAIAGANWLVKHQKSDGSFSAKKSFVYNESLATLALAEAYGLTKNADWGTSAQHGVDFLMRAQRPSPVDPNGLWGWRYASRMEVEDPRNATANPNYEKDLHESDTSATGWAILALNRAQRSGLKVNKANLDGAYAFAKSVTRDNGLVGYTDRETAGQLITGKNDYYVYHPAGMSALGMCIHMYSQHDAGDGFLDLAARRIVTDLPITTKDKLSIDYYYWYCGSVALDQLDGPDSTTRGGKYWNPWNKALVEAALPLQEKTDQACSNGAWLVPDRWSFTGGPIYATAINALTLEDALGWK